MKEVTRVATIQVTYIYRDVKDEKEVTSQEDEAKYIEQDLWGADNVLVTKIKDFVRDCDKQKGIRKDVDTGRMEDN